MGGVDAGGMGGSDEGGGGGRRIGDRYRVGDTVTAYHRGTNSWRVALLASLSGADRDKPASSAAVAEFEWCTTLDAPHRTAINALVRGDQVGGREFNGLQ